MLAEVSDNGGELERMKSVAEYSGKDILGTMVPMSCPKRWYGELGNLVLFQLGGEQ